jgi:hypothetical protein
MNIIIKRIKPKGVILYLNIHKLLQKQCLRIYIYDTAPSKYTIQDHNDGGSNGVMCGRGPRTPFHFQSQLNDKHSCRQESYDIYIYIYIYMTTLPPPSSRSCIVYLDEAVSYKPECRGFEIRHGE